MADRPDRPERTTRPRFALGRRWPGCMACGGARPSTHAEDIRGTVAYLCDRHWEAWVRVRAGRLSRLLERFWIH